MVHKSINTKAVNVSLKSLSSNDIGEPRHTKYIKGLLNGFSNMPSISSVSQSANYNKLTSKISALTNFQENKNALVNILNPLSAINYFEVESFKIASFNQNHEAIRKMLPRKGHHIRGVCAGYVYIYENIDLHNLNKNAEINEREVINFLKSDGIYLHATQAQDVYMQHRDFLENNDSLKAAALCYGIDLENICRVNAPSYDFFNNIFMRKENKNTELYFLNLQSKKCDSKREKKSWGHAICIKNIKEDGCVILFDPNYGAYKIPKNNFVNFIGKFLSSYYSEKKYEMPLDYILVNKASLSVRSDSIIIPNKGVYLKENSIKECRKIIFLMMQNNFNGMENFFKKIDENKNCNDYFINNIRDHVGYLEDAGETLINNFNKFEKLLIFKDSFLKNNEILSEIHFLKKILEDWQIACEYLYEICKIISENKDEKNFNKQSIFKLSYASGDGINSKFLENYINTKIYAFMDKLKEIGIKSEKLINAIRADSKYRKLLIKKEKEIENTILLSTYKRRPPKEYDERFFDETQQEIIDIIYYNKNNGAILDQFLKSKFGTSLSGTEVLKMLFDDDLTKEVITKFANKEQFSMDNFIHKEMADRYTNFLSKKAKESKNEDLILKYKNDTPKKYDERFFDETQQEIVDIIYYNGNNGAILDQFLKSKFKTGLGGMEVLKMLFDDDLTEEVITKFANKEQFSMDNLVHKEMADRYTDFLAQKAEEAKKEVENKKLILKYKNDIPKKYDERFFDETQQEIVDIIYYNKNNGAILDQFLKSKFKTGLGGMEVLKMLFDDDLTEEVITKFANKEQFSMDNLVHKEMADRYTDFLAQKAEEVKLG